MEFSCCQSQHTFYQGKCRRKQQPIEHQSMDVELNKDNDNEPIKHMGEFHIKYVRFQKYVYNNVKRNKCIRPF